VAEADLRSTLRRFPRTLGDLLVSPRAALRELDARERGGFSALVLWCLLAAVALRFAGLAEAVVGWEAGGLRQLLSVLVGELTEAVPVAIGASLLIVIAAGSKREPGVDLELGCAATLPYLVTRAAFRTAIVLSGVEAPLPLLRASYVVGAVWTLALALVGVGVARGRPNAGGNTGEIGTSGRRLGAPLAAAAAFGVLGVALIGSVTSTVRHADALGPVTRGQPAPDFTLPRVDGKPGSLTLSSLRGRVVVLDFWATWCPPCLAALPTMHALSRELEPKGVTFVGVDSDGEQTPPSEVTAFLAEHGAPYPVVYDRGEANALYRIRLLPTLVVVGKTGLVERVFVGITSRGTLVGAIDEAVAR
jgi:thiol-disulfide isomerase/thioredoxin